MFFSERDAKLAIYNRNYSKRRSLMSSLLVVLLASVVMLVIAIVAFVAVDANLKAASGASVALFIVVAAITFVAPDDLGYSRIPNVPEPFTRRLETGKVYIVIATDRVVGENDGKIVLVREVGSSKYLAIHVNVNASLLPERFTLIDGRPVGLVY